MRILHFSRTFSPHDHRFLTKMVETREEIFYLSLEGAATSYDDRPLPQGVTRLKWSQPKQKPTWRDGTRMVADLKSMVRKHKFDIIQAGPVQRAAFLTALAGFKNLVTMSWGYDLLIDLHKGPGWKWATEFTLHRSAAFVGDCLPIKDIAVEHGMPAEKIVTFPWGADIRTFSPPDGHRSVSTLRQRIGWDAGCFVLLSTRSWTPLYGVRDLVSEFIELAPKYPDLRLLMLGSGPQSEEVKGQIGSAGLQNRVHFPGLVSQADLLDYYRTADLYVSTSHSDGTSISMLEAMASGLPVLLRDIPGNREWAGGLPRVGWLFEDGRLGTAIENVLALRDSLPEIGATARRLAEEKGDWDKNFPMLKNAWQIALGT